MTEYNSIRTVLKELLLKTKNNIYNHFGGFLFLNVMLMALFTMVLILSVGVWLLMQIP